MQYIQVLFPDKYQEWDSSYDHLQIKFSQLMHFTFTGPMFVVDRDNSCVWFHYIINYIFPVQSLFYTLLIRRKKKNLMQYRYFKGKIEIHYINIVHLKFKGKHMNINTQSTLWNYYLYWIHRFLLLQIYKNNCNLPRK
jgi:hypothetical protein